MSFLPAVALWMVLAQADAPAWRQVTRDDGITVMARTSPGSSVAEVQATLLVDAPAEAVWRVIRDYPAYTKTMPYTEESRVLGSEQDGKVTFVYCLVNAPLVSKRDFIIRVLDESDWKGGQGYMKVTWTAAPQHPAQPEREGVVRVKLDDGSWLLEPREGGKKTFVTYYLHTDPGGSLPGWVADKANKTSMPDVMRSVRKAATAH